MNDYECGKYGVSDDFRVIEAFYLKSKACLNIDVNVNSRSLDAFYRTFEGNGTFIFNAQANQRSHHREHSALFSIECI